jgi:preprotein translocase subunit SecE
MAAGQRIERSNAGTGCRNSMANPGEFIRQVRQEASKVTWPTRKETGITTLMVFIMVVLAAIFFFVVDQLLAVAVRFILGLGA